MTIHHINAATTGLVRAARKMESVLQEIIDEDRRENKYHPFAEVAIDEWRTELRKSGYIVRESK